MIQIANCLLKNQKDDNAWIKLISSYCEEKNASKAAKVISIFTQLPVQIQMRMVEVAIRHYCRKFNIFSLEIEDSNTSFIINGVPQKQIKTLYYYI